MTSVTAKHTARGPLTDRTNVFNMKSSKIVDYMKVSKQISGPTVSLETPVKKRGRPKKNVVRDKSPTQIEGSVTFACENKVNEDILTTIPNDPNRVSKNHLFVNLIRVPNNQNSTVNTENSIVTNALPMAESRATTKAHSKTIAQVNYQEENKAIGKLQVSNQVIPDVETLSKDSTNVFNMESSRIVDYMKVSKQISRPTVSLETPVKKRGRPKKNVVLDKSPTQIEGSVTFASENKVKEDTLTTIPNDPNRVGKKDLFVNLTRIPNNENSTVNIENSIVTNVFPVAQSRATTKTHSKTIARVNYQEGNNAIGKLQVSNQVIPDVETLSKDSTNVFNMESSRIVDYMKVSKQISGQTVSLETPVKKRGRPKKNVVPDKSPTRIEGSVTFASENKVKEDTLTTIPNDPNRVGKNDLFVNLTRITNNEYSTVNIKNSIVTNVFPVVQSRATTKTHSKTIAQVNYQKENKAIEKLQLTSQDETIYHIDGMIAKFFRNKNNPKKINSNKETGGEMKLLLDKDAIEINTRNTIGGYTLYDKITLLSDVTTEKTSTNRTSNETDCMVESILLDKTIYQIDGKIANKNNAKKTNSNKETGGQMKLPLEKDAIESNSRNTIGGKTLYVKIPPLSDVTTEKTFTNRTSNETDCMVESILLDKTIYQIVGKIANKNNAKKTNSNKETGGQMKLPLEKDAIESNSRNTIGGKTLYVKIPPLSDVTTEKTSTNRTSNETDCMVESILLDKTIYQIVGKIANKNNAKKTNSNKETGGQMKLPLEKDAIESNSRNTIGGKTLYVKIPPLSDVTTEKTSTNRTSNETDCMVESILLDKTIYQIVGKIANKNNAKKTNSNKETGGQMKLPLEKDAIESNSRNTIGGKTLYVKIPPLSDVTAEKTSINHTSNETDCMVESLTEFLRPNLEFNENNVERTKETVDKAETIEFENNNTVETTTKNTVQIENNNEKVGRDIEDKQQTNQKFPTEKPLKNVKFDLKTKGMTSHDLRKLQPKNYAEESIVESTNTDKLVQVNLQKKDRLPIYRKIIVDEPKNNIQNDLYEFVDLSPKTKKIVKEKRPHRSSILFDKDTHEILQKIEAQEAKAKRKAGRKKKPCLKKSYDTKVAAIVSSITGNFVKKNTEANIKPAEKRNVDESIVVQNKLPIQNNVAYESHTKVIQVNSFNDETSIIVHHSAEVPSATGKSEPQGNITSRKVRYAEVLPFDTFDKVKGSADAIRTAALSDPDCITVCPDSDNPDAEDDLDGCFQSQRNVPLNDSHSVSPRPQNDIDSCFGFDDEMSPLVTSANKTVAKGVVNILGNVVVRHGSKDVQSPIDFNVRRPNANSTMIHIGARTGTSSPWRSNWVNSRPNPHFISVKSNALPRMDQEPVLDHTLVEGFESLCSQTPKKGSGTPAKKGPVQQSILPFVGGTVEQENEQLQGSLYDYEAFNSPVKKTQKDKENRGVERVKRYLLGDKNDIISSTPVQRRVLGDISNSSGEQILVCRSSEDNTFFGFNESPSVKKSPEKRKRGGQARLENIENDDVAKPSRFDLSVIRSYTAKGRKKTVAIAEKEEAVQIPDESISLVEVSNEDSAEESGHLFEDLEEMLDNTSPVPGKKHRRKRLESCDSHSEECEKKRKRHKKTKLEIEQEKWIEEFNQMCEEIDQHELILE